MKKENNSYLVTIGIPFYNSEKYLTYAINSVLLQSYTNWELLLMDDGSSDNSLNIAKSFEKKDRRIKVYSDGNNSKLPFRLNQLSNLAKGKFYARMDADDMMHPERIETQINYLISNPEIDLVGTGLVSIDGANRIIGIRKGYTSANFTKKEILSGNWCVHPTIMGKSDWFKKNKYDVNLTRTEDFDLWIRTIDNSKFSKIDFLGLYYREESELSLKKYITSTRQSLKLFWKNRKIIGISKSIYYSIEKLFKMLIYLFFEYSGLMEIIVKRRSDSISKTAIKSHNKIINKIMVYKIEQY
ncbi:glycosyltransferase family 2 protein [Gaetbulibacter sp. M240]|uniref:glycosyltransferase family 2 protein n=1 Tax=Gaetbulibacter sp. M240 TaxID=3126511 RepID=UPI00374E6FB8